jgi:hypothetical protein
MTMELLLQDECTLQGKPRNRPRTELQNQKLGIPPEHQQALSHIQQKNPLGRLRRILKSIRHREQTKLQTKLLTQQRIPNEHS